MHDGLHFLNGVIYFREELRGIKRGPNAKDVDWASVASSSKTILVTKPQAIKIPVSDILSKLNKAKPTASNDIVPDQDTNGL